MLSLVLVASHSHQQAQTCRGVSALRDVEGLCHELKCGCALRAAQTQESIAAALQKQLAKMDRSRPGSEQLLEVRPDQGGTPCTVRDCNEMPKYARRCFGLLSPEMRHAWLLCRELLVKP